MKTDFKTYIVNVFFISWLFFGLFYLDREDFSFQTNWFSYSGIVAFIAYLIYSLKKEMAKRNQS